MKYTELVPNNGVRVEISITDDNVNGQLVPQSGLAVTVRVAAGATATAALDPSLSYTCVEYTPSTDGRIDRRGAYTAVIQGVDIATYIAAHPGDVDRVVAIQFISGTSLLGYIVAIFRATRQLSSA